MNAVLNTLSLKEVNVSEDFSDFENSDTGAYYLEAENDYSEVPQEILSHCVLKNQLEPIEGYDECLLDCHPDDLFIEKSFRTLEQAENFVESFFSYFGEIDSVYCANTIENLRQFHKLTPSNKKLNCRFEIVSGDSCKRFHVDSVLARLIYTCAGPGTQVKHPDNKMYMTLPSGSALIVKGTKFPNFETVTLHRSPPIEGTEIKRFLFIADYL